MSDIFLTVIKIPHPKPKMFANMKTVCEVFVNHINQGEYLRYWLSMAGI